jgi:hypothetical protein
MAIFRPAAANFLATAGSSAMRLSPAVVSFGTTSLVGMGTPVTSTEKIMGGILPYSSGHL